MKATNIYKTAVVLLVFASITACSVNNNKKNIHENGTLMEPKGKSQFALKRLSVDKKRIMPYVTCSEQAVDSLLAIADIVYSNTGNYKIEDMEMGTESYNDGLKTTYNDTIPTIVALFYSNARIINAGQDEANASFVWHEVARMQMKHFFESTGGKWQEPDCQEILFKVVDGMMATYSCGNQPDMNVAAWRSIMPVDYRLIEAYKQLADLCNDKETTKVIHDDYMYTRNTYRAHRASIDEWYSDLPREQGTLFEWLLRSKLENINLLIKNYKRGKIDNNAVKKNLQEHLCRANKRLVKLTKGFLDRERDDFR